MPTTSKLDKPSLDEYPDWLRDNHDIDLWGGAEEGWYDSITLGLRDQFTRSAFWTTLLGRLSDWNAEYEAEHNGYSLLRETISPPISIKPYSSAVEKSYRYNVVQNKRWPSPPILATDEERARATRPEEAGDWYGPRNWLSRFSDITRTRLTTTYLDGVLFLADKLAVLAEEVGVEAEERFHARPDGYHAVHVLVGHTLGVSDLSTRTTVQVPTHVEIQVSTQIQETIARLLHSVYERWRLEEMPPERWQWEHDSTEFAVNYLGHTLHYLEGMIVVARERQG